MRRTAMISLFSADDPQMMQAKSGDIGTTAPWRWNANNSIVWDHCDESVFNAAFDEMIASGNGEPGLFSRTVARRLVPERRAMAEFGTNPCGGEI
jgi:ribonucleoside-diphosphate reductase alpha chain